MLANSPQYLVCTPLVCKYLAQLGVNLDWVILNLRNLKGFRFFISYCKFKIGKFNILSFIEVTPSLHASYNTDMVVKGSNLLL